MNRTGAIDLSFSAVSPACKFVLFSSPHGIISEHANGPEALKALTRYVQKTGKKAAILKRASTRWIIY
ncbi:MAG TPA: hypothetical protein VK633_08555 [Verrucomicrobiae bacterium]|nr:hypothetical protein [Verrucomicrobiae bacterium]